MASVWEEGTKVIVRAGMFSGWGGVVRGTFPQDEKPILVEIVNANTSRRSFTPEELQVVPQPVKRDTVRRPVSGFYSR